jgi:hypothetical protein
MIDAFSSPDQLRRRPAPVNTSIRWIGGARIAHQLSGRGFLRLVVHFARQAKRDGGILTRSLFNRPISGGNDARDRTIDGLPMVA